MKKTHNDSLAPKKQEQVELADIFRLYGDDYRRSHALSYEQLKVMHHIQICRTAVKYHPDLPPNSLKISG